MHRWGGKTRTTYTWHTIKMLISPITISGWENYHNHPESTSIQNSKLVLEQTKGHHRWQIHTIDVLQFGLEIAWRFGTIEEDSCPSRYATLLGSSCPWSTHQNNRSSGSHRWCVEEEVKLQWRLFCCSFRGFEDVFNKKKFFLNPKNGNCVDGVAQCSKFHFSKVDSSKIWFLERFVPFLRCQGSVSHAVVQSDRILFEIKTPMLAAWRYQSKS